MNWKPKVGDTCFIRGCQSYTSSVEREEVVTKVGRKYFSIKGYDFHLSNHREKTDCSPSVQVFESRQHYIEQKYLAEQRSNLESLFREGTRRLSDDQVQRMNLIFQEPTTPQ